MKLLLQEIRRNPLLWLLVFVPIALATEKFNHEAHTLHFVLSVLAILPLAVLLSHATESVAAKTGDSVGGLLNATLGNVAEHETLGKAGLNQELSLALSFLLLLAYGLGLWFSLNTHRELFASTAEQH